MYISYTIVNLLLLLGVYNDIMGKSHEQRLVNKEHIEMHKLSLKISALYSSGITLLGQNFTTHFITKPMPNININSKCHMKMCIAVELLLKIYFTYLNSY